MYESDICSVTVKFSFELIFAILFCFVLLFTDTLNMELVCSQPFLNSTSAVFAVAEPVTLMVNVTDVFNDFRKSRFSWFIDDLLFAEGSNPHLSLTFNTSGVYNISCEAVVFYSPDGNGLLERRGTVSRLLQLDGNLTNCIAH